MISPRVLVERPRLADSGSKAAAKPARSSEYFSREHPQPSSSPSPAYNLARLRPLAPGEAEGRLKSVPALSRPIQAKLEVGAVDDPLEHEADRVAEQILRIPDSAGTTPSLSPAISRVQRKCACGGSCDKCKSEQTDEEHERLHRKPASVGVAGPASAPPIVHNALRSPSRRLDTATRSFFESRFGFDFSHVRVHTDASAAASAKALGARAYTAGSDMVFAGGQFAPTSAGGRALLAHELAHVVQQDSDRQGSRSSIIRRSCDPKDMRSATVCTPSSDAAIPLADSNPFLIKFEVGCDSFASGEELRLRTIALATGAAARIQDMKVRFDGFASEEGDEKFNKTLSCARALKVGSIFLSAGIKSSQMQLFSHGATAGDRPTHRSVLISAAAVPSTAKPDPTPKPTPVPEPKPKPKPDDTDMWPHFRPKGPTDPSMWPHFTKPSILDRLKRRLRDLKDALKRGVDILSDLEDLASDISGIVGALLAATAVAGAAGEAAEIAELLKLLDEVNKLKDSLPKKPAPPPPGAGRGSRDPNFDKPDVEPEPKPEPKPEPQEKKPEEKKPEEKKPEEKKPEEKKPDEDKPKETCKTKAPNRVLCGSLQSFYNVSGPNCFSASAQGLARLQTRESIPLTRQNQQPATEGPCVGRGGEHFNVNRGSFYYGAIVCCPCCSETPAGPLLQCRCGFIRKRGTDRIKEPFP